MDGQHTAQVNEGVRNNNTLNHLVPIPKLGVKTTRAALKIASLNIRSGGSYATKGKWDQINQLICNNQLGIMAVQEAHLKHTNVQDLHCRFLSCLHILNCPDPSHTNAKGVAFVLNKHLTVWKEAQCDSIIPGWVALLRILQQKESILSVLAIYVPNCPQENTIFWESLNEIWTDKNLPISDDMLGDFNIVEEAIDRLPMYHDNHQVVSALQNFKETLLVVDGWRQLFQDKMAYTYTQDATQSRSQIDQAYVSNKVLEFSRRWQIDTIALKTDHKMISLEIVDPGSPYIGKGWWAIPLYLGLRAVTVN